MLANIDTAPYFGSDVAVRISNRLETYNAHMQRLMSGITKFYDDISGITKIAQDHGAVIMQKVKDLGDVSIAVDVNSAPGMLATYVSAEQIISQTKDQLLKIRRNIELSNSRKVDLDCLESFKKQICYDMTLLYVYKSAFTITLDVIAEFSPSKEQINQETINRPLTIFDAVLRNLDAIVDKVDSAKASLSKTEVETNAIDVIDNYVNFATSRLKNIQTKINQLKKIGGSTNEQEHDTNSNKLRRLEAAKSEGFLYGLILGIVLSGIVCYVSTTADNKDTTPVAKVYQSKSENIAQNTTQYSTLATIDPDLKIGEVFYDSREQVHYRIAKIQKTASYPYVLQHIMPSDSRSFGEIIRVTAKSRIFRQRVTLDQELIDEIEDRSEILRKMLDKNSD